MKLSCCGYCFTWKVKLFLFFLIPNHAVMKIHLLVSLSTCVTSSSKYPGYELLAHWLHSSSSQVDVVKLLSKLVLSIYITTSNRVYFPPSDKQHMLQSDFWNVCQPNMCKVYLHLPDYYYDWHVFIYWRFKFPFLWITFLPTLPLVRLYVFVWI